MFYTILICISLLLLGIPQDLRRVGIYNSITIENTEKDKHLSHLSSVIDTLAMYIHVYTAA